MDWLGPAVANVFALSNLLWLFLAVAGGILVGALPGLTGTMAIALMVPFTYPMSPEAALIVLGGIYVGAMYGGSISAILINTPGVPASIATTFDGYPMACQGRAEEALCAAATGSGVGGLFGNGGSAVLRSGSGCGRVEVRASRVFLARHYGPCHHRKPFGP